MSKKSPNGPPVNFVGSPPMGDQIGQAKPRRITRDPNAPAPRRLYLEETLRRRDKSLKRIFSVDKKAEVPSKEYKITWTTVDQSFEVVGSLHSIIAVRAMLKAILDSGGELVSTECEPVGEGIKYSVSDLDHMLGSIGTDKNGGSGADSSA